MNTILLGPRNHLPEAPVFCIPGSKSATNRYLVLADLAGGGPDIIQHKSPARDSVIMESCLRSQAGVWDVHDAGTAMRFLLARACLLDRPVTLTGTARMKERPLADLVDGLRQIGFDIRYLEKEGFPPVRVQPVAGLVPNRSVSIRGGMSSQFVSALLMIAPCLSGGLELQVVDQPVSRPYVMMTVNAMREFGAQVDCIGNKYSIAGGGYHLPEHIAVPGDWSSAVFAILSVGLGNVGQVSIPRLVPDLEQADSQVLNWCPMLGIAANQGAEGMLFSSTDPNPEAFSGETLDFTDCPDLAPAMVVSVALRGLSCTFTGMESLRIKECDRVEALQEGLGRCGIRLMEISQGKFRLSGSFRTPDRAVPTFGDHRMAMAFALISHLAEVRIEDPGVVVKSFPDFWEQWARLARVIEGQA